jgi:hypothetical protein
VGHIKKTMNISTVRATPETREELEATVKRLGFRSIAHFFTRAMETLLEQAASGESLRWPLLFERTRKASAKRLRSGRRS